MSTNPESNRVWKQYPQISELNLELTSTNGVTDGELNKFIATLKPGDKVVLTSEGIYKVKKDE